MSDFLGDFPVGQTVYCFFNTHKADGTPITLAGTPAISIYKNNSTTQTTTGPTLTVDFDSVTGMHCVAVATTDSFYVAGADYKIVITTGTVDSVSVVGSVVGSFSLNNRTPAIRRNTAQAGAAGTITLDSSASASDDFYNKTLIMIIGGTGVGQVRLCTDYTGSSKVANVSPNWVTNPSSDSIFVILPAGYADMWGVAGTAQTARDMGAGVTLADDAITAAKFDESTAYPLKSADTGSTAVARTGADSDTLKTLSDQADGINTKTTNLPASPAAVGSAMTLADDAITAAKFDESTAYPLKSADTGSTKVARTGADSDTLETISDQIDGAEAKVDTVDAVADAIKAKTDQMTYVWRNTS